jgi:hypothetical protein
MVLGFGKSRWGSGIFLLLISWGILTAEIHGMLGHTLSVSADSAQFSGNSTPDPHHARPQALHNYPLCSICLTFRLLRHSLVPSIQCIVASLYYYEPISIQQICLIEADAPREENRSPPVA